MLDYVSYIDSQGVEHPRESINFYWDVEVINEKEELRIKLLNEQVENARLAVKTADIARDCMLIKREALTGTILSGLIAGLYSRSWDDKEDADFVKQAVKLSGMLLDEFQKEE